MDNGDTKDLVDAAQALLDAEQAALDERKKALGERRRALTRTDDKTGMPCPTRTGGVAITKPEEDHWRTDGTCSYCGSMHPVAFLKAIRDEGATVTPTDKNYKAYVDRAGQERAGWGKFYYQHFDEAQGREFVQLHNDKKMKIGMPGHFYVLPFFMKRPEKSEKSG